MTGVSRSNEKHMNLLLTAEEVASLTRIQMVLMPWKKLTVLLSGDSCPTLSLVAPPIQKLLMSLKVNQDTDCELVQAMKEAMRADLVTRYQADDLKMLLHMAAFLDPRFRSLAYLNTESDKKEN